MSYPLAALKPDVAGAALHHAVGQLQPLQHRLGAPATIDSSSSYACAGVAIFTSSTLSNW